MKPIKLSQSEIARAETTPQGRKYTTAVRPQADGSRTAFLVWVDTGESVERDGNPVMKRIDYQRGGAVCALDDLLRSMGNPVDEGIKSVKEIESAIEGNKALLELIYKSPNGNNTYMREYRIKRVENPGWAKDSLAALSMGSHGEGWVQFFVDFDVWTLFTSRLPVKGVKGIFDLIKLLLGVWKNSKSLVDFKDTMREKGFTFEDKEDIQETGPEELMHRSELLDGLAQEARKAGDIEKAEALEKERDDLAKEAEAKEICLDAFPGDVEDESVEAPVQDSIKPGSRVVWNSGDQKVSGIVKQLVKDGRVAVVRVRHATDVRRDPGDKGRFPIEAGEDLRVLVSELTPDLEEAVSPKDLLGTCEGLEDDPSALALAKASSDKKLAEITLHRSKRQDCEEVVKAAAQELARRGISVEDASKLLGEAKKEGGKVDRREEKAIRELWKQPKAILMELAMEQSDGDGSEFEEYDADELAVFLAEAGYRVRNGKVLPPSSGGDLDEVTFSVKDLEAAIEGDKALLGLIYKSPNGCNAYQREYLIKRVENPSWAPKSLAALTMSAKGGGEIQFWVDLDEVNTLVSSHQSVSGVKGILEKVRLVLAAWKASTSPENFKESLEGMGFTFREEQLGESTAESPMQFKAGSLVDFEIPRGKGAGIIRFIEQGKDEGLARVRIKRIEARGETEGLPLEVGDDIRIPVSQLSHRVGEAVSPKALTELCEAVSKEELMGMEAVRSLIDLQQRAIKNPGYREMAIAAAENLGAILRSSDPFEEAMKVLGGFAAERGEKKAVEEINFMLQKDKERAGVGVFEGLCEGLDKTFHWGKWKDLKRKGFSDTDRAPSGMEWLGEPVMYRKEESGEEEWILRDEKGESWSKEDQEKAHKLGYAIGDIRVNKEDFFFVRKGQGVVSEVDFQTEEEE